VLYELLAGAPPFQGETDMVLARQHLEDMPPHPRQFNPRLEPGIWRALQAALSKDPRQRPVSASLLLHELCERRSSPLEVVVTAVQQRPWTLPVLAGVLLAVGLGMTVVLQSPPPTPTPTPLIAVTTPATVSNPLTVVPPRDTPTLTLIPTSTKAPITPTPTKRPVTLTPSPALTLSPDVACQRAPIKGDDLKQQKVVTFKWCEPLPVGGKFYIKLTHVSGNIKGPLIEFATVTTQTWSRTFNATEFGEWQWEVRILDASGTLVRALETWHFYIAPQ